MNNLFFEYPWVLWLELLLVPMAAWYVWKQVRRRRPYVAMSTTAPFSAASAGLARVLRHLPAADSGHRPAPQFVQCQPDRHRGY